MITSLLRPGLLIAALSTAALLLPTGAGTGAEPSTAIESTATYQLRPDQDTLHVNINVSLERVSDSPPIPDRVAIPVIAGATNLSAAAEDGRPLETEQSRPPGKAYELVTVPFGKRLDRGETMNVRLDYDLSPVDLDTMVVSGTYVSVPVFAIGEPGIVRLDLPADELWFALVEPLDCERAGAVTEQTFVCTESAAVYEVVRVHLVNQAGYRLLEATAQTPSATQPFELRYMASDAGWASNVRDLTIRGLPVLESVIGVPLEAREDFTLLEVERVELGGYEGVFWCMEEQLCRIGVVQGAIDHVILHELAHMWTTKFEKRWLAEGIAEFAATRAGEQLGLPAPPPFSAPYAGTVYLDEWGDTLLAIEPSEEQILRELAGYEQSVRFFKDLEAAIGMDAIRQANLAANESEDTNSQDYMDLLEEASGGNPAVTALFRDRVFTPDFAATLDRRALAKERLAELIWTAAQTEFTPRTDGIEQEIDNWNFFTALDLIDYAHAFMKAYPAAQEASKHVSLWGRVGLIGQDPEGDLEKAQAAFDAGDYAEAARRAEAAERAWTNASRTATNRALFAAGALVFLVTVIFGGRWALRGERPEAEPGGGQT
jgi:hypothetical protein